jgi:hypothetical protein
MIKKKGQNLMSFNAFGLKVLAQRSILAAAIGTTLASAARAA